MTSERRKIRGRIRKDAATYRDGTFLGEATEENRYHLRPGTNEPKALTLVGSTGKPTYGTLPAVLMIDKDLTSNAKVLWSYLNFRQGKNESAWPSQATIEAHTNLSRATISRATKDLESLGWLVVYRVTMGTQRWNSYKALIPNYAQDRINSGVKKQQGTPQIEGDSASNRSGSLLQNDAVKTPSITLINNTNTTKHQSRLMPDFSNFFQTVND
jgi:hypothetical protein